MLVLGLTGKPSPLQDEPLRGVSSANVEKCLRELRDLSQEPVSDDLAARFLCGIATPRLTRLKARQLNAFGRFEKHPYKEVRSRVRRGA